MDIKRTLIKNIAIYNGYDQDGVDNSIRKIKIIIERVQVMRLGTTTNSSITKTRELNNYDSVFIPRNKDKLMNADNGLYYRVIDTMGISTNFLINLKRTLFILQTAFD